MKKVTVVARYETDKFRGVVELVYGEPRIGDHKRPLQKVDVSGASLSDDTHEWIFARIPVWYGAGYAQQWTDKVLVTEMEFELEFDRDFWGPYGKKVNKDRVQALWDKLPKADRIQAVASIPPYLRYLGRVAYRAKADPESYLRKKFYNTNWENLNS